MICEMLLSSSLLLGLKALRSGSIIVSILSLEMGSFLICSSLMESLIPSSMLEITPFGMVVLVIQVLEGVVGISLMVSTSFPKGEGGVSILSPSKW